MEQITLTCRECGHREAGEAARALMVRVRMLNHLTRVHPDLTEPFKTAVSQSASAGASH